jgi:hypothetical protein
MLTRRTFMGRLAAVAAVAAMPLSMVRAKRVETDGHPDHLVAMTPEGMQVATVLWDGHDITRTCASCNRKEGWARCFFAESHVTVKGDRHYLRIVEPDTTHVIYGQITVIFRDSKELISPTVAYLGPNDSGWMRISFRRDRFDF